MRPVYAVAALALALSSQGEAARWETSSFGKDGTVVFVDMSSVTNEGDAVKFWMKMDYSKVKSMPQRSSISLTLIRCTQRTVAMLSVINYRPTGDVMSAWDSPNAYADYQLIVPDSIIDFVRKKLCGV